jgi:outer membrane protein assembly factor BamB
MSSYRGLAVDADNLYVTQSDGTVVAMRQRDGAELWRNEKLKRRGLSTPVVTSTAIAVADFQGYLHWLDKNTGELVARERVAKKQRVSNPPVGAGDTVVVLTDGGTLAAYRATPKFSSPRPAPAREPAKESTVPASEPTPTTPPAAATESVPAAENPAPQPAAPPPVTPPPATPPP